MDKKYIDLFWNIPEFKTWREISKINKGWSTDEKFHIKSAAGEHFLLRLNNISEFERKKSEFEAMKLICSTKINMSKPIDFGICSKGEKVYTLLTFVDGDTAEEVLKELSENEQYNLGIEAGTILRKIHSVPVDNILIDSKKAFQKKLDKKMLQYENCAVKIPNDTRFIE